MILENLLLRKKYYVFLNLQKKYKEKFFNIIKQEGYTRNDIYNSDETDMNWKALPQKSLASRRESSAPGYKVIKCRITAMVCKNAREEYALPLLMIGKAIISQCFKNVNRLPVTYKVQKNCMDELQIIL